MKYNNIPIILKISYTPKITFNKITKIIIFGFNINFVKI